MKGQYLTIENIFFFAIGVLLVISIYFAFSAISGHLKQETMEKDLQKTAEFISNEITKTYIYGNFTNSSLLFTLNIPYAILGNEYFVEPSGNNLNISFTSINIQKSLPLRNIEIEGKRIYSNAGVLKINYTNNKIFLS